MAELSERQKRMQARMARVKAAMPQRQTVRVEPANEQLREIGRASCRERV